MHDYVMGTLGEYVKKTYCCPENFTMNDLQELKCWGKAMESLLLADREYHIVSSMEEHGDGSGVEMEWPEFEDRLKNMYAEADSAMKTQMKQAVYKIMT